MTYSMGFISWLRSQRDRGDPVGDLACDWERDRGRKPRGPVRLARLHAYLSSRLAGAEAHQALSDAWAEWAALRAAGGASE